MLQQLIFIKRCGFAYMAGREIIRRYSEWHYLTFHSDGI